MADDSSERFVLLNQLADEFNARYRRGERPSLQEYIDRHPHLADDIREYFPALAEMEQVKDDHQAPEEQAASRVLPPLERLGDFRIIREIGHGGMGVVYEAEQISLGRHVALKVLPKQLLADARTKRRFEREARAAAKLHHTNIVPVFGVGEHEGLPYYVMQFIPGLGLDEVLEELQRLQPGKPGSGSAPGLTGGELRVSRREVSAAAAAGSLITGRFSQAVGQDRNPAPHVDMPAARIDATAEHVPGAAASSRGADAAGAPNETPIAGRLSDTFSLSSSSVVLPGTERQLGKKQLTYWQSVARIGVQVADALEYAHRQGIQHRDIKPSNLLLDTAGAVWVTDFGLAKADDQQNLTHVGDILGTLRYMPPEAFDGKTDARSDVYSLGLTLYELLAFRPAFDEPERNRLIKQVTTAEPARLDRLNREFPRDLVTIVHKAIERDLAHRYPSAGLLAADLKRFLDDEPIQARRQTQVERYVRWARRNPGIAVLGGVLTAVLVLATVASLLAAGYFNQLRLNEARIAQNERNARHEAELARQAETSQRERAEMEKGRADDNAQKADDEARSARKAEQAAMALATAEAEANRLAQREQQRAEAEKKRAEEQLTRVEWLVYAGKLSLAQNAFQEGNGRLGLQYLDECRWNLRGWEHRHLRTRFNAKLTLQGQVAAFSPDGKRIVTGSGDLAKVWDAEKGKQLLTLKGHTRPVNSVAFSSDGKRIVTGGMDNTAKVFDAETGQEVVTLKGHKSYLCSAVFSPDGTRIATGSHDETAKVWDAVNGLEVFALNGQTGEVWSVAFSPNGKRIVTGSHIAMPKVWDAETGKELLALKGHTGYVWSVAYSPDGKRIVTGGGDKTAKVWDADKGQEVLALKGHTSGVHSVAFSPDGKRIVTGGDDGTARVWDAEKGQEVLSIKGNVGGLTGALNSVAFSPDGKRLVTGSRDGTAKVWDAVNGQDVVALNGQTGEVWSVAFSPGGTRLVTGSHSAMPKVWDAETGREHLLLRGHKGYVWSAAYSPDGARIVTGGGDRTAKVWDADNGQELFALNGHAGEVFGVAYSPDGKRILTGSQDGTAKVWDAATGKEVLILKGHTGEVYCVAFSPDGARIVTGGVDGTAKVWDATTSEVIRTLKAHPGGFTGRLKSVAFSPDGKRIATGSHDMTAKVWDAETGQEQLTLKGHTGYVVSVAFSPDGKRIITGSEDWTAKVWDAEKGQEVLALKGHTNGVLSVAFSPDGTRVATGGHDGTAKVWHAEKGQNVPALKGHTARVLSVAFSPDGKRIVSGSKDGTAKVWDVEKGQEVLALKGHTGWVSSVAFSTDGKRIFAWDTQQKVLAWSAADGKPIDSVDPPAAAWPGPARSPDGILQAVPQGNTIVVTDTRQASAIVRNEDKLANNAERLEDAWFAFQQKKFAFAVQLWAEALAADPKLGDDRRSYHRYNAACAAALAAAGQGQDEPPLDDLANAKLRRQALDWLKADLTAWGKHLESGLPQARPTVVQKLSHWQKDSDLAGIRDQAALAKLPAEEQKAFIQLWADVAELLKKAENPDEAGLQDLRFILRALRRSQCSRFRECLLSRRRLSDEPDCASMKSRADSRLGETRNAPVV